MRCDSSGKIFLRPENAQGEYVNYLNVMRSMRAELPFSIGQIGIPFAITVDDDTLENGTVTVRDTMEQSVISVDELIKHI